LAIHTYPAIKFSDDREALQQGLVDGPICTTATDEWTTYKNVKLAGDTIRTLCGGHNGIETRMPVTYTKLVAPGRIGLERFAAITSTNAAKILGMYPQKGPSPWAVTPTSYLRPQPQEDDNGGRASRGVGLLHLGWLRVRGLPDKDHAAWQGHREGRATVGR